MPYRRRLWRIDSLRQAMGAGTDRKAAEIKRIELRRKVMMKRALIKDYIETPNIL